MIIRKPFNTKCPYTKDQIKAMEMEDKRLVDVMYFAGDEGDHVIDHNKYNDFPGRFKVFHGKRQKVPYMLYKYIQDNCYIPGHEHSVKPDGSPDENRKASKNYFHKFELLE